jgi:hypothetical protein
MVSKVPAFKESIFSTSSMVSPVLAQGIAPVILLPAVF